VTTPDYKAGESVMVDRGMIYFADSIYALSTFRSAHLQRGIDHDYRSVIDVGADAV
jgi:hypothetical protein